MSKNVGDLSFNLSARYNGDGLRLARTELQNFRDALKEMPQEQADWMKGLSAKSKSLNSGPQESFDSTAIAEENRQKQLDKEVWAARARLLDEQVQNETEAATRRQKTESVLSQARILSTQKEAQALVQKYNKAETDAQTLAAVEKNRHQQAMNFILQEGDAASGRMVGGINRGSTTADNNRNNRGFQGAQIYQQLGFGLQDFMSQVQNSSSGIDGLGRGIMAVSNNVQMMGSAFGPTGLAVTAIGGALIGTIVPAAIKWFDESSKIEEKTKATKAAYEALKAEMLGVRDAARFGTGSQGAFDANKQIESLTNQMSSAARASGIIRRKIEEEMAGANDQPRIEALRQNLKEVAKEYADAETRRDVLKEQYKASDRATAQPREKGVSTAKTLADERRQAELQEMAVRDRIMEEYKTKEQELIKLRIGGALSVAEFEKAKSDAAAKRDIDLRKEAQSELERQNKEYADNEKATITGLIQSENEKQFGISENLDAMKKLDQTPNGSSAANVRGTGAAVSAINRAIAGTNSEESDRKKQISEESDRKKQIKVLEDQLKVSQNIERKLNLQRAAL